MPYLLCLLCQPALADTAMVRQLHELDSHSRLLCASALLYFDPRERSPDPRSLTAVYHHLNTLETDVLQLGQPADLAQPLGAMQRIFTELDGLPRSASRRYPELIARLLEQRQQLGEAVEQDLAEAGSRAPAFGAQSRDLASLLLDYQLRHYLLPQKAPWLLPAERLNQLDADIEQRFDQLQAQYQAQAAALGKIRGSYRFVRRQLQQGGSGGEGNGGAEFYLSRAVLDLDDLAQVVEQGVP
ncbi:hypothetical protein A9179_14525 [Pseudomonas alcaligenes]|uniref:Uncharacterized protein n=1 Tax=Aquipseudomonas alcaligenes TaxID=43263 RepID=A0ABR7S1Y2_AQUAC|nr:hypothetical protein [Pseudomonas alcaligenes]